MFTQELKSLLHRFPGLFFGFFLCSLGILFTLYAGLGMNPWGVFHLGIVKHTGLTLGQVSQLTGFVIIAISIFLGIVPGIGSILNMYIIGELIDVIESTNLLFTPPTIIGKLIMLSLGVIITGWGSFFYLSSGLGGGPRDNLMLGLVKRLNYPVSWVRTSMEVIVLILGIILGGTFGIGTIIIALTTGHSVQLAFRLGGYDAKETKHRTLRDEYNIFYNALRLKVAQK